MESINKFFSDFSEFLSPWLIIFLVGTGILLTVKLRGIQFRQLAYAFRLVGSKESKGKGDISHLGALMTALAGTIGVGNIAGVGTAIALGGPGAVFWMWITGLFGMATKYTEGFLAVRYRKINEYGKICGGPMYYLKFGVKSRFLGSLFAFFGTFAAFGIGNMTQANTTAHAITEIINIDTVVIGIILATLTGLVIFGGIQRIAEVTTILVPTMIILYFFGTLLVIVKNLRYIGSGILLILNHAFSGTAATGGFTGATLVQTFRFGVARGLFSNESGLGSAPIAAAAAKTNQPSKQGLVSMTGTFIDTLVVCSLTAIILTITDVWTSGETGVALTQKAFARTLPGLWGSGLVSITVTTFAFSTILAWEYYGEKCFEFIFGLRYILYYRLAWICFIFIGAVAKLELVWNFADVMNALMALPNLLGLILLSGVLVRRTRIFEKWVMSGKI